MEGGWEDGGMLGGSGGEGEWLREAEGCGLWRERVGGGKLGVDLVKKHPQCCVCVCVWGGAVCLCILTKLTPR